MPLLRALIADDEPLARQRMRRLLAAHPAQVAVVAEAGNGEEARELIEALRPELLFLDIEMPLLGGFEVLGRLSYPPLVVFVTAYDHYALRAFEENSVGYLLKPVEAERLAAVLDKIERLAGRPGGPPSLSPQQLAELAQALRPAPAPVSLPVKVGERVLFVRLDEVAYFVAEDKYVYLHTQEGHRHLLDTSLTALAERLPEHFIRVSRAEVVNKNWVKEVSKLFGGRFLVRLADRPRTEITTGSSYASQVRQWLGL
ncbi:MAG: LytTR family DNA-binding domain-containing protein [Bernardetiaceae bacterium]|jgi:two-component system LytT family response regulator|nr:LytTR family DNA-binding domain-containing protein [Bernardetiaceae bacterium]